MERPTHKLVGDERIELTDDEADAIMAEWEANLADIVPYKQSIDTKVQQLLDAKAIEYRYDNMQQVAQFSNVDNEYQAEALDLLDWNARVWELTEAHIAEVSEIPDYDFIETLPKFD